MTKKNDTDTPDTARRRLLGGMATTGALLALGGVQDVTAAGKKTPGPAPTGAALDALLEKHIGNVVVIYAEKTQHLWQLAMLVGYGVVIGLATGVAFSLAVPIARVLGKTGINVMTRLMGLILAALAVEVMADGLGKLFPILGRAAVG